MRRTIINAGRDAKQKEAIDPVDIHVGGRLRLRRNLLGISQEQMGKALGVTFQQIQKYERGTNRVAVGNLLKMAQVLGVSFDWFIKGLDSSASLPRLGFSDIKQAPLEDVPVAPYDLPENVLEHKETTELIRAYHRVQDPKQRRKILDLVKSMTDHPE